MGLKLVELEEGVMLQVQGPDREIAPMGLAGEDAREKPVVPKADQSIDAVGDLVTKGCRPFIAAMSSLRDHAGADSATVEFGVAFTNRGNPYITDNKSQSNFQVRVQWRFKSEDKDKD